MAEPGDIRICPAVACEALKRYKLRPKEPLWAAEQNRPEIAAEREAYRRQMSAAPAERLVFLDESCVTTRVATPTRGPHAGSIPIAPSLSARGSG
jgi:hypothetical protein